MKIVVENISVVRGEDLIFSNLSFAVSAGEALVIRGSNGVGKSTLLRALAGLLPFEVGSAEIEGLGEEFGEARLAELCHYLGPENAMKPSMTVEENLVFWQQFSGQPHLDIDEAIEMVGLGGLGTVPFAHLSTGQSRRIAIARLLVSYRPIWLLDEPTSGLDVASETQFAALMEAHLEDQGIIIAATHIPLGLKRMEELVFKESAVLGAGE
ncbi:MAG: heme ABC exporter ATP-binding protein CcmA [Rhizobiaceae bacterium]